MCFFFFNVFLIPLFIFLKRKRVELDLGKGEDLEKLEKQRVIRIHV